MNPAGRAFVLARLTQAPDLAALRRVWDDLGDECKRDPEVIETKDKMKEQME